MWYRTTDLKTTHETFHPRFADRRFFRHRIRWFSRMDERAGCFRQTAPRPHRRRRPRVEGRGLQRLHRHQDPPSRQARDGRGETDAILRATDVHPDAGRAHDRPLSLPLRPPDGGDSLGLRLRARHGGGPDAAGSQEGGLQDRDRREMAPRPRRQEVVAPPARLRLPIRGDDR